MKKITIVDVALAAHVSTATVSRVLNGGYPVREKSRQAVLEAIKKLGYVPNLQARELNLRQSTVVGVIVPNLFNMFFAQVFASISQCLERQGYSTLIACSGDDAEQEKKNMELFLARNVRGIINVSPNTHEKPADFYASLSSRLPLVFINSYKKEPHISYVNSDEEAGVRQAMELLFRKGHKKIALLRGACSDSYDIKQDVYCRIMHKHSLKAQVIRIEGGNSMRTIDCAAQEMRHFLIEQPEVTAIFACNDLMAVATLEAARLLGKKVSQELAIIGFDNIVLSRYTSPQLTTVDQKMHGLGKAAVAALLQKIALDNGESTTLTLPTCLLERGTV